MNSYYHAKSSAMKWGGEPETYLAIHDFIDHSKAAVPDMRHRSMLHNSWGIFLVQQVFGPTMHVGRHNRKRVPTRLIAERHILEDLGFIPTLEDWLEHMTLQPWMSGAKKRREIPAFGATP